jgi:hypothetical protein
MFWDLEQDRERERGLSLLAVWTAKSSEERGFSAALGVGSIFPAWAMESNEKRKISATLDVGSRSQHGGQIPVWR